MTRQRWISSKSRKRGSPGRLRTRGYNTTSYSSIPASCHAYCFPSLLLSFARSTTRRKGTVYSLMLTPHRPCPHSRCHLSELYRADFSLPFVLCPCCLFLPPIRSTIGRWGTVYLLLLTFHRPPRPLYCCLPVFSSTVSSRLRFSGSN